jgi:hypothetical protein
MDIVRSMHLTFGQLPHLLIAMRLRQRAPLLDHLVYASVGDSDRCR